MTPQEKIMLMLQIFTVIAVADFVFGDTVPFLVMFPASFIKAGIAGQNLNNQTQ